MIAAAPVLEHIPHTAAPPAARAMVKVLRPHFRPDNALVDDYLERIGPYAFTLYCVLLRHANRKTGMCWPSIATLAKKMHVSRPTIIKYLRQLAGIGLIDYTERFGPSGRQTSHVYTVYPAIPDAAPVAPEPPGEEQTDLPPPTDSPSCREQTDLPLEQSFTEQAPPKISFSALQKKTITTLIVLNDYRGTPADVDRQAKQDRCPHPLAMRYEPYAGYQICRKCHYDGFIVLAEAGQLPGREGPPHREEIRE